MKTSRFLGLVALATLTLGSCSNDEVVNNYSQDNAIQFGTYMGRDVESRGQIITTDLLKKSEDGFGVFAYYHKDTYNLGDNFSANFMNNEKITWDSNKNEWTYSPVKYWPNNNGDKVSFIAYAPYHENEVFPFQGKLKYTVSTSVTEQEDLLWSKSQNFNKTKYDYGTDGKVEFTFGHALSRVYFTIAAGVDLTNMGGTLAKETTIYVDQVTIKGLNTTGTLDLYAATATWSDWNTVEDYVWDYKYENDDETELDNYVIEGDSHASALPLFKTDNDYFVIPQTLNENFAIEVVYRVFTVDDKLTEGKVEEQEGKTGSLVKNVISVTPGDLSSFEAGKQYKLNLILGMTSVKLNVKVEEWTNLAGEYWFNENGEKNNNDATGGDNQGTEGSEQ